jgi:GAF domain-containing protein
MALGITILSRSKYKMLQHQLSTIEEQRNIELEFLQEFEKTHYRKFPEWNVPFQSDMVAQFKNLHNAIQELIQENEHTRWHDAGMVKFNDILTRSSRAQQTVFYDTLIAEFVNYLQANQGALFIVNDSNSASYTIEMAACYAYNKKKYEKRIFAEGEGLVGQCLLEQSSIFMTDVPQYYTKITSGLGEATPTSILITPLIDERGIIGAVELASFRVFTPAEIKFVEALAKNIASTIYAINQAEKIKELYEASQLSEASVREQEEEIKQQVEELQATNEEMTRNAAELERAKIMLEQKNQEIERIKENEKRLLESKLEAQKHSYELIINRLKEKLVENKKQLITQYQ